MAGWLETGGDTETGGVVPWKVGEGRGSASAGCPVHPTRITARLHERRYKRRVVTAYDRYVHPLTSHLESSP